MQPTVGIVACGGNMGATTTGAQGGRVMFAHQVIKDIDGVFGKTLGLVVVT